MIRYKDMAYGIGMEIRCINNFEIDKVKVKNKRVFVIKSIEGNRVTIKSDDIVVDSGGLRPVPAVHRQLC